MTLRTYIRNLIIAPSEELKYKWVIGKLSRLTAGKTILDVGAGEMPYKQYCRKLLYKSQDFGGYSGRETKKGLRGVEFNSRKVDIISDICDIPLRSSVIDYILCTDVLEHIPDPLSALKEMHRINIKGGKLIMTAPSWSLTHFSPFYYYSGFSENFYRDNLPKMGYRIDELYIYGNYFDSIAGEYVRIPFIIFSYNKILLLLYLPLLLISVPWYIVLRILSMIFPGSKDILSSGICLTATKIS